PGVLLAPRAAPGAGASNLPAAPASCPGTRSSGRGDPYENDSRARPDTRFHETGEGQRELPALVLPRRSRGRGGAWRPAPAGGQTGQEDRAIRLNGLFGPSVRAHTYRIRRRRGAKGNLRPRTTTNGSRPHTLGQTMARALCWP